MRSFHFPGRSPVYGRRAMCATSHPAASLTAIETLQAGRQRGRRGHRHRRRAGRGRAADDGHRRRLLRDDGQARPQEADRAQRFGPRAQGRNGGLARQGQGLKRIETTSAHAVTVPGAIDGWCGCSRITAPCRSTALLAPAIELAERGFVVAPRVAADWARDVAQAARQRRGQEAPAQGRPRAAGRRGHALPGARRARSRPSPRRAATASTRARWPRTWWPS